MPSNQALFEYRESSRYGKLYVFREGGGEGDWWLVLDANVGRQSICRHCYVKAVEGLSCGPYAHCPRALTTCNQGGHDSTIICLDCVLEGLAAIASLPRPVTSTENK